MINIYGTPPALIGAGRKGTIPFVKLGGISDFDLAATMECGQCFRFSRVPDSCHECEYSGVAGGRFISVGQDGDALTFYNINEEDYISFFAHYFGLDCDYGAIKRDIISRSERDVLCRAVSIGGGIRILAQEPWEALCSFIISQNNNIPRIRGLVRAISRQYGKPIDCGDLAAHGAEATEYAFPSPQSLFSAGVDALAALKTGFRAKYIYDAACKVTDGRLTLSAVAAEEKTSAAADMLMTVSGVGPKVAACTLLFGFARLDAFPIDVWIKRVIAKYFPGEFDAAALGPYAGVAQQYLFYYERLLSAGGEK